MLDPGSLAVLGGHFERLMGAIQGRVEQVSQAPFDTNFFFLSFALMKSFSFLFLFFFKKKNPAFNFAFFSFSFPFLFFLPSFFL